jgi:hypothetical protein
VTASAVAEKYGVPFLNAESVAANLTERGFKWFFRTTPVAIDFARAYSQFLKEQKAAGQKVGSIAPGKLADLVVMDKDYLTIPADQIKDIKPVMTFVGGKMAYGGATPARATK